MDGVLSLMILLFTFMLFALSLVFHPIQRVKNYLFPTYLYDPKDGKSYKLVVYEGYDKYSSVVATVRELGKNYDRNVSDEYNTWIKSKTVPKRAILRLVKGQNEKT